MLPSRQAEAMAWPTSAIPIGIAVGSAAAGQIVDMARACGGYACAAAAMLACQFGLTWLTVPSSVPSLAVLITAMRKGEQPPWIVPDELWARIEPLLPPSGRPQRQGRCSP
ncbi:hypothetical protein [Nonomuraea sp. B12E4]|uniref:hypothetical protein n=1 Tax=Nonomuraea sp. B12E4 TaxID=3153564 RepID=UPI00325FCDEB